jgi:hypothetical protein
MMGPLTPPPRSAALGGVRTRLAGDVGHIAVVAADYSIVAFASVSPHLGPRLLPLALGYLVPETNAVDPHVSPAIVCVECCLPVFVCTCGEE